jgi:carbamoyl-phosphate synthase large subunit
MKSVGEVMAIGRTFQESLQKALRGLETGLTASTRSRSQRPTARKSRPRARRARPGAHLVRRRAFRIGMTLDEVHELTAIDPWFLAQIEEIVEIEAADPRQAADAPRRMRALKRKGFSDKPPGALLGTTKHAVRERAHELLGVRPVYKRVDTCAAEFATETAYMYSTYEDECEASPTSKKIMVLGGGPNRIGQGIEFDYCCVHAALAMREDGYETIMVNCNPETVSTDYDTSDRLYFEPLTLEDVLEIVDKSKSPRRHRPVRRPDAAEAGARPGSQRRADHRHQPDMIDAAEDRERFQKLLHELGLKQPPNRTARTEPRALRLAAEIGYPLVVRPLRAGRPRDGNRARARRTSSATCARRCKVSNDSPVLLDRFLNDAIEVDVDALSDGTRC